MAQLYVLLTWQILNREVARSKKTYLACHDACHLATCRFAVPPSSCMRLRCRQQVSSRGSIGPGAESRARTKHAERVGGAGSSQWLSAFCYYSLMYVKPPWCTKGSWEAVERPATLRPEAGLQARAIKGLSTCGPAEVLLPLASRPKTARQLWTPKGRRQPSARMAR